MVRTVLSSPIAARLARHRPLFGFSLAVLLAAVPGAANAEVLTAPAEPSATADSTAATGGTVGVMSPEELVAMADSIAHEVEELRGWEFKTPVPKNVRSEGELRDYMVESFEKDFPGDRPQRIGASLAMVGLLPPGSDLMEIMMEVLMNQVGGFYDPPTKAFYMVNREGMDMPVAAMKIMVAHELTHALDDQYVDLESLIRMDDRTEDAEFAGASVVEGSATILMSRYLTRLQLAGELTMEQLMAVMESEAERSKPFLEAPPYFHTILARYTLGMLFLLRGDMGLVMSPDAGETVGERFLAAANDPPQSSEQILHPEKYWEEAERDLPVRVVDESVERLVAGAGLRTLHRETFGEILVAIACREESFALNFMNASTAAAWTDSAAMGWGGDRFYLLGPLVGDGDASGGQPPLSPFEELRGLWITVWDTPRDREEFTAAYALARGEGGSHFVLMGERGAAVLINMHGDETDALEEALLSSPPVFLKGDETWMP